MTHDSRIRDSNYINAYEAASKLYDAKKAHSIDFSVKKSDYDPHFGPEYVLDNVDIFKDTWAVSSIYVWIKGGKELRKVRVSDHSLKGSYPDIKISINDWVDEQYYADELMKFVDDPNKRTAEQYQMEYHMKMAEDYFEWKNSPEGEKDITDSEAYAIIEKFNKATPDNLSMAESHRSGGFGEPSLVDLHLCDENLPWHEDSEMQPQIASLYPHNDGSYSIQWDLEGEFDTDGDVVEKAENLDELIRLAIEYQTKFIRKKSD